MPNVGATKAGIRSLRQVPQPIIYDSLQLDEGYRLDLLVEDSIIVEVKAVEALAAVHHLQVKTYLKLSGKTLGILINFNVPLLKEGLHRIVLNHPEGKEVFKRKERQDR